MNIINIIKGFFIGIAFVIPGLSGSTFALVVGLYEKIIDSINNVAKKTVDSIKFLTPIGIGIAIGVLASTKFILWVCETYQFESYLFFIGLVIGSAPFVTRRICKIKFNPIYLLLTIVCFAITLLVTEAGSTGDKTHIVFTSLSSFNDVLTMVFAGALSVSIMAIPGVSGSLVLMSIGQYGTVYNAVGSSIDFVSFLLKGDMAMAGQAFSTVLIIIPFGIGALAGLLFIAKVMGFLLHKYESLVYYGVAGLIIGAVVTLAKQGVINNYRPSNGVIPLIVGAIFVVIGILCTALLDKPEDKK